MTITLGQYGATGASGFTNFGTGPTGGASVIYVSSSLGSDTYDGSSPTFVSGTTGPVASVGKATALINALSNGLGHWMLLRRGDVFNSFASANTGDWFDNSGGSWNRSGASGSFNGTWWGDSTTWSGSPILISCYDENYPIGTYGPNPIESANSRPVICYPAGRDCLNTGGGGANAGNNIAFFGIKMYCSNRDPNNTSGPYQPYYTGGVGTSNSSGVSLYHNSAIDLNFFTFVLFEDCEITFHTHNGISVDSDSTSFTNLTIRRCIITDGWAADASASTGVGTINGCNYLLLEENVLDHNGWNEDIPDGLGDSFTPDFTDRGFHHNIYLQSACGPTVWVRGNIFARDANQIDTRCPLQLTDNLFVQNRGGCGVMNQFWTTQNADVYHNVIIENGGNGWATDGFRVQSNYAGSAMNLGTVTIRSNIFCHTSLTGVESQVGCWSGVNGISITNNIAYDVGSTVEDFHITNGSILTISQTTNGSGGVAGPTTYTGVSLTGGTGTGAKANITVTSGAVSAIALYAPTSTEGGYPSYGGTGYTAGDVLSCAAADIGGGISGHTFTVGSPVSSNSKSANNTDDYPANSNGYSAPSRTVGNYASTQGWTATTVGFLTQARTNTKQTWSAAKTAPAVNDYIRAGFGLGARLVHPLLYRVRAHI